MSKVLITGHKGAVGSRLMKKLAAYGLDHMMRDLKGKWELVGIDTKDGQNLMTCELPPDVDVVYHLAAHASVEDSWKDPVRDAENILTTIRLTHFYPNAKIIYASSCATINPASPYGFSKKCAADYLKLFHKNVVICVFPNIFGTGRSVVDFFKGKDKVTIYGDGKHTRDYVHVDDIVNGLDKAFFWEAGEYFMGSGKAVSVLELAEGKEIVFEPERKEAVESLIPNTTPNWKPTIDVIDYLHEN